MLDIMTVRTMLFTPGNRPERFEKAKEIGADGIVIDLEDAISLAEKDKARQIVIDYFKNSKPLNHFVRCLRINSIKTPAGIKDISAIIDNQISPDLLIIPKTEYAAELVILDTLLKANPLPYIALIETALGISQADSIALASPHLRAICFGGGDLAADLGAELTWEPMLVFRTAVIRAAAIAGIAAWDVPYLHLHDPDENGIKEETRRVKALGFTGKFAVHPKHIQPIIDVFSPAKEEIERAKRIVDAYEKAEGNVCEIDGKMIDIPIVRSAKRVLALASR